MANGEIRLTQGDWAKCLTELIKRLDRKMDYAAAFDEEFLALTPKL
jgi:hypothetical protein